MITSIKRLRTMSTYKLLLIWLVVFLLTNNSFAQFQASVWGGVNGSSFGGNPPEDASYQSIYGLSFGGNLDFNITNEAIISIEPSFEQKGSKIIFGDEEKILDTVRTYNVHQNYFGLGILFKIETKRFFVGGGLSYQLLSTAKLEFESSETDIKDKFRNYDVVSFFNVGYKIPVGVPTIFIELRYIQGLVNINADNSASSEDYISKFKSTGLKLSTGIMFPL
jgi:hypothetical protein